MNFINAIRDVIDGNIPAEETLEFHLFAARESWREFLLLFSCILLIVVVIGYCT